MYDNKKGGKKSKHSANGNIPANGLSELEADDMTNARRGLDSHGPNQLHIGIAKQKVTTEHGSFNVRKLDREAEAPLLMGERSATKKRKRRKGRGREGRRVMK